MPRHPPIALSNLAVFYILDACITFYNYKSQEFVDRIEDMAGVKLERVSVPSEQDMVKANTKGILKKLNDVDMEVLPMFEDTADLLINQHNGDASKAL